MDGVDVEEEDEAADEEEPLLALSHLALLPFISTGWLLLGVTAATLITLAVDAAAAVAVAVVAVLIMASLDFNSIEVLTLVDETDDWSVLSASALTVLP